MELELGLKITRTREDVSSSVDFRFSKDPFGPLVLSRETDSRFIIIIHLKGFKKEGVEIEINKEGNRITIRGRKPVEEMVLIRWMAWKKEVELRAFRKVFLIPNIVDLDKIKARFDDDDATLTITMPKRVRGISGFKLEEEEEEESMDFGDVSEAQSREEVEEENVEREESDGDSEIQREEEFGEMMEDKERESQIFEGEEEGSIEGLDEEETRVEDDDLEKIQQIDEQDKTLEFAEKETVGQQELAEPNTESEDSSLRKLPGIIEQKDNQEVMEKQVETKSEGTESRAVEENEEQEHDELDRTSKNRATEKKTSDGDDDGLSKAQGIEEPERHNEESKIRETVEEETGGQEKKNTVTMEMKNKEAKEEFDGKMGEGPTPNIERTGVVAEDNIAETETNADEFESEKPEADEVDKKHGLVERKEEEKRESDNVRSVSEDGSLIKLQEKEEQEPDEQLDRTSKGGATENKTTDDDGDGLSKVQGIEEPERHSERSKTQDMVEGKGGEEKKKSLKREIKNGDAKEDVDEKKGFTPNTDRTQVVGEDDIAETETKSEEFVSDKQEADEVDKKHEPVEKIEEEEENANVRKKSEDGSFMKLQENEEQHSKRGKRQDKQKNIKELVEEKTPEAETNTANDVPKPVPEIEVPELSTSGTTGDEGKVKTKSVNLEVKNRDAKEEVDAKTGVPNTAETEPEDFEADKLETNELDKIHDLVERKKEEEEEKNAKVGTQSEHISLTKPQEIEEQQSDGQKRDNKHEKIKELVKEQTPEAETNRGNDTLKPVQERCEGKHKIQKNFQEEAKRQPEEHKEKMVETGKKVNDAASRKVQEIVRQQELDDSEMYENESKPVESVKSRTNDEEKEEKKIAETETKEQESYRPKLHGEQYTIQELAEEKTDFLKNGDISRKVGDNQQRDSDSKEEVDAEMGEGLTPNIGETETKAEEFESDKLEPDEVDEIHELVEKKEEEEENAKVRRKSGDRSLTKLQENETQHTKGHKRQEKTPETETNIPKPVPETEVTEVDTFRKTGDEGKEGKEKKKSGYPKKEVDAKSGKGFTPNIGETETKAEEFESEPDKGGEIHELVEKKEEEDENAKVRRKSEDRSLTKLQENETQHTKGHKRQEKTPETETNIPKPVPETEVLEVDTLGKTGDEGKEGKEKKKSGYPKKEVDAKSGKGFTPNIGETETKSEQFKSEPDKVGEIHELVEKKEEEDENAKVRRQSEDSSLIKKLQEAEEQQIQGQKRHNKQEIIKELVEEKVLAAETNMANQISKPVQETEKPEVDTLETCEDKEFAETETKEQESFRPKIVEGEDKPAEEKMNLSRKVHEEEETAEKKTELGDDDMSRKVRDAVKGHEEKDKIQKLVLEEKVSDGGKGIVAEAITENDKSIKVPETDEKQPHEEDKRGNHFQKHIGGETSGHGEVEDVENEKKTTEADKRFRDSAREAQEIERKDSDVSEKYGKGDTFQEFQENRTTYPNEQEEEEDEADRPEKVTGTIEQELVNLNSQMEQDNVEDVEETRELVEDKTTGCKEEESETKTDDVVRKVQGIHEQELFEPKMDHVSKIKEVVEEKAAESEIEAERSGLSKVHGTEEQELHEPNIHKERDKTKINGTEEPSGLEKEENEKVVESLTITEKENSTNAQEIREDRPDTLESHDKQYKVQEPVEVGHNDHTKDQKDENLIVKAKRETEEDSSKKVQEIQKQESDGSNRSVVQDKMQELEEEEITRAVKEKEIVERTKKEDGSLRKLQDDADPELSKPYKRREEEKIQEPVETGTSDYREKFNKPTLDEFERHGEQRNIPQLVDEEKMENIAEPGGRLEDDNSGKFHEFEEPKSHDNWTQEEREKIKDIVKEEAPDLKHTGGEGHNDHKEEKVIPKAEVKAEEDSSAKVQEIEKQESDELQRSLVHDKMQETEEKGKTRAMEENEIVEGRTKTEDGSLRKVREGEDPELGRDMRHEEECRIQELVEEDSSAKVKEIEKQESDELQRSLVHDKMQETEEKGKTRAMKENEIVEGRTKTEDGSLRKVREGENPELGRDKGHEEEYRIQELVETDTSDHREKLKKKDEDDILRSQETTKLDLGELEKFCKERKIHQPVEDEKEGKMENISELGGQKEGDSSGEFHEFQIKKTYENCRQEDSEEIEGLFKAESAGRKDIHTGGTGEHEEEKYEKVPQASTKVEDELNKKVGENKNEEENLVDDSTRKIQETEKEESHESEIHEKLDIVQGFVEDKTGDQEDERAGEAAAVVANNEKDSSMKLHSIEGEEPEENKEQDDIPETSDPRVKEEDGERVSEKETKEQEAHAQKVEGKTENFKDDDGEVRRGEKGKQGKTVETKSDDGIVRKILEASVEPEEKIEELERKKTSNHEVELVTEDDSLRQGQEFLENESSNVSKRGPVEQEKIQQLKREDEEKSVADTKIKAGKSGKLEMQELDESEENEELKKIRKPMEEEKSATEKEKRKEGNEKTAEEEMQAKKDQQTQRQEPYVPEPIVEGTIYQREEEKRMADREIEEVKRKSEDASSGKVLKVKAEESDGLEKHMKLNEIQDNQPVEEKIQEHGEEEVNEGGGYKAVLKTKSMEDSSHSQDVEEKGSDQTERYAEQEKIQELMVEEERKEKYDIREGEQKEKAMRISQVESKANDDSSKKNETERFRGQKQNEDHQELMEIEKSGERKEEKKDQIVGKGEAVDHEYDTHEHEKGKSDKLERHEEEEMSGSLAKEEMSNDIEENKGNRAGAETKIRDDGFEEEESAIVVGHREQGKKRSFVAKDTTAKAKENKNQETKSRDDSSIKTRENAKQESHEQTRNYEQEKRNLGPNCCRNEEDDDTEDTVTAQAEGTIKLKGIEKRESTKMVERHGNQDNINELVEEKMSNEEGEDKESMSMEVLAISEGHEPKGPERMRKQDKGRELVQQRLGDNLEDEETGEEERRKGQELVEDRTHYCREKEYEDGSSKKTPEIDKEELTEPGRDEKRDKIEEPVDKETSEDDEEELEVEVEDSEEDWEAEVIQEMGSDEDSDKIRQIRRIKLGFRLVGGSTLFMSLIVIVISFIRSKRKIRCYRF